jgi:hypothetical protein
MVLVTMETEGNRLASKERASLMPSVLSSDLFCQL